MRASAGWPAAFVSASTANTPTASPRAWSTPTGRPDPPSRWRGHPCVSLRRVGRRKARESVVAIEAGRTLQEEAHPRAAAGKGAVRRPGHLDAIDVGRDHIPDDRGPDHVAVLHPVLRAILVAQVGEFRKGPVPAHNVRIPVLCLAAAE